MKAHLTNLYLSSDGHLLDHPDSSDITVAMVAKFDSFPAHRNMRRKSQSVAAKMLLADTLKQFFTHYKIDVLNIQKTNKGQPFLVGENAPFISISHSGNWAACAASSFTLVGIDIEEIKPRDWPMYEQDVFHSAEMQWILAATDIERDMRALTCWCRKEALLKAIGLGLATDLTAISFAPNGDLIALPPELGSKNIWKTHSSILQDEAILAIAWKI